jgi:hypothetical protein
MRVSRVTERGLSGRPARAKRGQKITKRGQKILSSSEAEPRARPSEAEPR